MTIGIYRIVNSITGRTYIGSSINVTKRLKDHRYKLAYNRHVNKYLLASWNKHGESVFIFEPLIECTQPELAQREQQFIDAYVEHDLPLYNLKPSADPRSSIRYVTTQETRAKQSKAHSGRVVSAETCLKIQNYQRARSPEHIANLLLARQVRSPEYKVKISNTLLGHTVSQETRDKISIGHLGKHLSAEHKLKIIAVNTGKKRSQKIREKFSRIAKLRVLTYPMPSRKGVVYSAEQRLVIRAKRAKTVSRKQVEHII